VQDVYNECFALREQAARDRAGRENAEKTLAEAGARAKADAERVRAEYEAKPAVRLSRRVHRTLDAMPRPLAAPLRWGIRVLKRLAGGVAA
jgi:hypothetical protein